MTNNPNRDEAVTRRQDLLDAAGGPEKFLDYNSETGVFTWKPRGDARWDAQYAGKQAGWRFSDGYIGITLSVTGYSAAYLAHRLAFRVFHGRWPLPGFVVHHTNAIRDDNRIANLEEATTRGNARAHYGVTEVQKRQKGVLRATAVFETYDRLVAEAVQRELNEVLKRHAAVEHREVAKRARR